MSLAAILISGILHRFIQLAIARLFGMFTFSAMEILQRTHGRRCGILSIVLGCQFVVVFCIFLTLGLGDVSKKCTI